MKIKWHILASIGSTNTYLTGLQGGDPEYDCEVAVSDYQTAGRGQRGNTWESQPGKNLLFSILAHPLQVEVSRQFVISQAIALSVCESLDRFLGPELGAHVRIKWPNDIYWKDFKMAGILIEHTVMGSRIEHTVAGVGLDVNQPVFESDAPNPISMSTVAGHEFDRQEILADIVERFAAFMEQPFVGSGTDAKYKARMYRSTGFYEYQDVNGSFMARISGVEPDGCLVLETSNGELRTYEFKQVRFVLPAKQKSE